MMLINKLMCASSSKFYFRVWLLATGILSQYFVLYDYLNNLLVINQQKKKAPITFDFAPRAKGKYRNTVHIVFLINKNFNFSILMNKNSCVNW